MRSTSSAHVIALTISSPYCPCCRHALRILLQAGFTFRSAASARPDAFVIAPMGKDFPQGNTVDLGDKYRLVIKVGWLHAVAD